MAVADIDVVHPGSEAYDDAVRLWNGAVEHRPVAVVRCRSADDVQAGLALAREQGLPVSVRGGGHDWAGRALRDGGVVLDLQGMRDVALDAGARTATVGGGARAADVVAVTEPHGLVPSTGTVGGVGVAGLTLGGGYGPLMGAVGLAADNLLGAEVVLPDGRLVHADAEHEPDLFWALRGGGGNFGVVTSLRLRLHPIPAVTSGIVMFPWEQAAGVLAGWADLVAGAPDELTVQAGVLPGPDGAPVAFVAPTWCGPDGGGDGWTARLRALGTPVFEQVAAMPYSALLAALGSQIPDGLPVAMRNRWLPGLDAGALDAVLAAGERRTSAGSGIFLHHVHGAPVRVPADATAFGLRTEHVLVELFASWEQGDPAVHRAWADDAAAGLAPHVLPGGYANLLGPDEPDLARDAYGANAARLRAVKDAVDPDGVLCAIPLP
jgi:FAD/FMN-containing dehydrogenase